MTPLLVPMAFDFVNSWNLFFNPFKSSFPGAVRAASVFGTVIFVLALVRFFWKKRKGGANPRELAIELFVAMILTGPEIIVPLFLRIAGLVANAIVAIVNAIVK